jgi:hypothetical protein
MKTYTVKIDEYGTKRWYINNKLHREDGPAVECADGYKAWYINGKLHRENGPAAEYADGDKWWYINGKLHRENGPAAEYADGDKWWYINDVELTEEQFNNRTNKNLTPSVKVVEIDGVKYELKKLD